jgi:hypothetical protein
MTWSKPVQTSWGAYKSEKEGSGTLYSRETDGKSIDHHNHVHFHKDGITITKDGEEKYTILKGNRS